MTKITDSDVDTIVQMPRGKNDMTDQVYQLLNAPRKIKFKILRLEAKYQALEFSLMPGGIRYDKDKVQTSPVDRMPETAGELAELDEKIQQLKIRYREKIKDLESACSKIEDENQRTVLVMFYLSQTSVRQIAQNMGYAESSIYRIRRHGQDALDAILQMQDPERR